jgi:hypothetical protein
MVSLVYREGRTGGGGRSWATQLRGTERLVVGAPARWSSLALFNKDMKLLKRVSAACA